MQKISDRFSLDVLKQILEIYGEGEFTDQEIASATLEAYVNILTGSKEHDEQEYMIQSIKNILKEAGKNKCTDKKVGSMILSLSKASNIFLSDKIEELTVSYINKTVANLRSIKGVDIFIDTSKGDRLIFLCSALSKLEDTDLLFSAVQCYKINPESYNLDTFPIFEGTNKNGTLLAINILKSIYGTKNRDALTIRNALTLNKLDKIIGKLTKIANSADEYMPIGQAAEKDAVAAIVGLRELKECFPDLDIPFDEYYVRWSKDQADDKNKSMVKENRVRSNL